MLQDPDRRVYGLCVRMDREAACTLGLVYRSLTSQAEELRPAARRIPMPEPLQELF